MLYFIRSGQYVKIGVSANPWQRLAEFQTAIDGIFELLLQVTDRLETLEARVAALEAATPPTPPQEQQHD